MEKSSGPKDQRLEGKGRGRCLGLVPRWPCSVGWETQEGEQASAGRAQVILPGAVGGVCGPPGAAGRRPSRFQGLKLRRESTVQL